MFHKGASKSHRHICSSVTNDFTVVVEDTSSVDYIDAVSVVDVDAQNHETEVWSRS